MFQKFIPILCILLPSCFFSDQVYIKKIWTFSMVDGYKNCMYDIKNNNFIIKSFHFGSDLTDVYFDLLYKKYNIKNDDCSRPYHSPSKSYVESYNRCVCRHIKKTFGEDIFKKAYQEAKVKYKKILQKENRNLQDTQKKAAVVSNVKFDFKPTSENRKNLYFVLLHYPSGAVSEVKEGEFIDPGFYYYNPLLKGYQPKQEMLKVRVCCGKKKVFLGGILIKISVEN